MPEKLFASKWVKIVCRKESFRTFCKVFHWTRHGIGFDGCRSTVSKSLFHLIVQALAFGLLVRFFDLGVAEPIRKKAIVVSVS